MGEIVNFPPGTLADNHELIADLCRFSEGVLTEQQVRKRHRLPDNVWKQMGSDDLLVEKIEAEKVRRMRDGSAKREKAQKLVMTAPDVLESIMSDTNANAKHRIDSAVVLDRFAANGPEAAAPADRFIISIVLNGDVETYNKSIAINANDTPPEAIPFASFKGEDSDDER